MFQKPLQEWQFSTHVKCTHQSFPKRPPQPSDAKNMNTLRSQRKDAPLTKDTPLTPESLRMYEAKCYLLLYQKNVSMEERSLLKETAQNIDRYMKHLKQRTLLGYTAHDDDRTAYARAQYIAHILSEMGNHLEEEASVVNKSDADTDVVRPVEPTTLDISLTPSKQATKSNGTMFLSPKHKLKKKKVILNGPSRRKSVVPCKVSQPLPSSIEMSTQAYYAEQAEKYIREVLNYTVNTWIEFKHETKNIPYYQNKYTKEVVWKRPHERWVACDSNGDCSIESSSNKSSSDFSSSDLNNQEGTNMANVKHRVYYYDVLTGETSWEDPRLYTSLQYIPGSVVCIPNQRYDASRNSVDLPSFWFALVKKRFVVKLNEVDGIESACYDLQWLRETKLGSKEYKLTSVHFQAREHEMQLVPFMLPTPYKHDLYQCPPDFIPIESIK